MTMMLISSCYKEMTTPEGYKRPAVDVHAPKTTFTSPQKPGVEVTLTGVNLENTAKVLVGGVKAQVTAVSFRTLTFIMPLVEEWEQNKTNQTTIELISTAEKEGEWSWKMDYFIFVDPYEAIITSCTPLAGTVGDEITLAGYNFDQITTLTLGEVTIAAKDFLSATKEQIKFTVPDAAYTPGDNPLKLKFAWTDDNGIVKDGQFAADFTVKTPSVATMTPVEGTPALGDVLVFTGTNMDIYDEVYVGQFKASIVKTATELKVTIPVESYAAALKAAAKKSRAGMSAVVDVVGHYGTPVKKVTLKSGLTIDTTPPAVLPPSYTSVIPVDGGDAAPYRFYLKKEVAVVGEELHNIKKITVGGLEATIKEGADATSLTFIMPEAFTFNTMTQVAIKAYYGDENTESVVIADAAVYPYYLWKGKKLMAQDETNMGWNFFSFDTGEVVDGRVYLGLDAADNVVKANMWDHYIISATTPDSKTFTGSTCTAAGILDKTVVTSESDYLAIKPYTFLTVGSSNAGRLNNPTGSVGQIRNQKFMAKDATKGTSLSAKAPLYYAGTPMVTFRVLTGSENANNVAIKAGTIESLAAEVILTNTSTPTIAAAEASGTFVEGSVILVQYLSYNKGTTKYAPANIGEVLKSGYIVITGGDLQTTSNVTTSYITFDCLWPYNNRD